MVAEMPLDNRPVNPFASLLSYARYRGRQPREAHDTI
jgi:hypothetical protein